MFDCYVIDKRTLYLHFISTLVISARSVFYLIVTLRDKHTLYLFFIVTLLIKYTFCFVFDCYVSDKCTLFLCFVATLVRSAHYICTSFSR